MTRKRHLQIGFEPLEHRRMLSADFIQHTIPLPGRIAWTGDIDGDEHIDILVTAEDGVWQFEATNEVGTFASRKLIDAALTSVQGVDMDSDGDVDLYGEFPAGRYAWFERLAGDEPTFSSEPNSTYAFTEFADLDSDGDLDAIEIIDDLTYAWRETTGEEVGIGPRHPLNVPNYEGDSNYSFPTRSGLLVIDMDADGDLDLFASPNYHGAYYWLENRDGLGDFENRHTLHPNKWLGWFSIEDMDGDGDLDLAGYAGGDVFFTHTFWIENLGQGQQFTENSVPYGIYSHSADLNLDGLPDLLDPGTHGRPPRAILNTPSDPGTFQDPIEVVITPDFGLRGVFHRVDIDGDGDVDILAEGPSNTFDPTYEIHAYESLESATENPIGDSNRDGVVDFEDYLILSANMGRENTDRQLGDHDGNGVVTPADMIILQRNFGRKGVSS